MWPKILISIISTISLCTQAFGSESLPTDSVQVIGLSNTSSSNSTSAQQGTKQAQLTPIRKEDIVTITSQDIVMGDPRAKVIVIEYSSPTCPHCAIYHRTLFSKIKRDYIETGKIAYVMRETVTNKQDKCAATLMRCGAKRGSSMHKKTVDSIFELQQRWAFNKSFEAILTNIGQVIGISAEEYQSCLKDEEIQQQLLWHRKLLDSYSRVWGTPMFFVNGQQIPADFGQLYKEIRKAVEQGQS